MDQLWRPGKAKQYKNKQNLGGPGEGQKPKLGGLERHPEMAKLIWGLDWPKFGAWKRPKGPSLET